MLTLPKITPCLWFDGKAQQAAEFYTGIFPNSKMGTISRYTEAGREHHGQEPGSVLMVAFELDGTAFSALNGGPMFKFTEAVSFQISCDSQDEVDHYWDQLSEGGDDNAQQCGWLKDRYGLSWQVVPKALLEMISSPDTLKAGRALQAMMDMKKLDIATLRRAFEG